MYWDRAGGGRECGIATALSLREEGGKRSIKLKSKRHNINKRCLGDLLFHKRMTGWSPLNKFRLFWSARFTNLTRVISEVAFLFWKKNSSNTARASHKIWDLDWSITLIIWADNSLKKLLPLSERFSGNSDKLGRKAQNYLPRVRLINVKSKYHETLCLSEYT